MFNFIIILILLLCIVAAPSIPLMHDHDISMQLLNTKSIVCTTIVHLLNDISIVLDIVSFGWGNFPII